MFSPQEYLYQDPGENNYPDIPHPRPSSPPLYPSWSPLANGVFVPPACGKDDKTIGENDYGWGGDYFHKSIIFSHSHPTYPYSCYTKPLHTSISASTNVSLFFLEQFCICLGLYPGDRFDRTISSKWIGPKNGTTNFSHRPIRWIMFVKKMTNSLKLLILLYICWLLWHRLIGVTSNHQRRTRSMHRQRATRSGDNPRYFSNLFRST